MQNNNQEWEGFQSFNDEIRLTAPAVLLHKPTSNNKSEPTNHSQHQLRTTQSDSPNKKIVSFKNHKRRKFSLLQLEDNKKRQYKNSNQVLRSQSKRLSLRVEKSPKKQGTIKEYKIPIFRFPSFIQTGKLIYKGFLPTVANQYLSYSDWDSMRGTSQGMVMDEREVIFNSRFQSGNLDMVRKLNSEYHLYLAPDTNTRGHKQWFYFTISSQKQRKVRLIIHGFKKPFSLFQKGMKPYGKRIQDSDEFWGEIGNNVRYLKQETRLSENKSKVQQKNQAPLYCLTFFLTLQSSVTYSIASSIPYTYSRLMNQLNLYDQNPNKIIKFKQSTLCKTLMGLQTPLITLNTPSTKKYEQNKYLIINARTHPGQSSSSWVAQGILQYIITSLEAQKIMKESNVIIKIVPMLNPDGVYMGNYRTGIMGIDFNRLFLSGKPNIFPQIQALRSLVRQCKEQGQVDLYLDLHGHSINPGCFFYGPDPKFAPSSDLKDLRSKMKTSAYFQDRHCINGVDSSKTQTSRVYFQIHQGVYSLTCQNSLGLTYKTPYSTQQVSCQDWKDFGRDLIKTILSIYKHQNKSKQELCFDKILHTQQLKNKQQKQEVYFKRYKTESQNLVQHLACLQQLQSQDIQILNPVKEVNRQQELDDEHLNDSDSQSQDLNQNNTDELFEIVNSIVQGRKDSDRQKTFGYEETGRKWWFKDRFNKNQDKGQCIGNFKQYRFGYEDSTLSDWMTRKRELSIPRPLRNQKVNNSYIIRKAVPKINQNQLIFQSFQLAKRIKTQAKQAKTLRVHSRGKFPM